MSILGTKRPGPQDQEPGPEGRTRSQDKVPGPLSALCTVRLGHRTPSKEKEIAGVVKAEAVDKQSMDKRDRGLAQADLQL
ncbi:MAG: hypothetical protein L6R35_000397 [Caloplaca aegaea]|nr:MAG: hypothetical protein L6R35_000397 [Caloplaca aegaea]